MTEAVGLYRRLLCAYGPQGWWPAEKPFEVIVGAMLVQRTAWRNAALAIDQLRRDDLLEPDRIARLDEAALAELIRPAGFWRIKSVRLRSVARAICSAGGLAKLRRRETADLRDFFMAVHGIGEETADAILLYAFGRPVVVVDAYLRRLVSRVEGSPERMTRRADRQLRQTIAAALTGVSELNEWHALVVEHGKAHCRTRPVCGGCCLYEICRTGARERQSPL